MYCLIALKGKPMQVCIVCIVKSLPSVYKRTVPLEILMHLS